MLSRLLLILLFLSPTLAIAEQHSAGDPLDYTLDVSFDIQASQIRGHARIGVKKGREVKLYKGNLHILEIYMEKQKVDIAGRMETINLQPSEDGFVEIRYVGTFKSLERPDGIAGQTPSRLPARVIDQRGIFLTGIWYPKADRMCTYRLAVTLPVDYEAVSEAETVVTATREGRKVFSFHFPHPLDSLTLIATNRYQVTQDHFRDTGIFAYFFPEDQKLAKSYIEFTKRFLQLYEDLIGKYPYQRFSIVENFLPTGYSMPTYTLLGQNVVKLPFIVETSLGHEILHQWFGNLVYVDYEKGNWAEGLTTYLADHLHEDQKGKGFKYRKGALIDYQSYVNEKNEFSLKHFHGRNNRSSQAIGYGKSLMIFHMLKNLLGEGTFYDSLRYFVGEMRFRKATWDDMQRAFEKNSKRDLDWFFRQWLDEKGVADFHLEDNIQIRSLEGKIEIQFTITQKKKVYTFDLPISFYSSTSRVKGLFPINKGRNELRVLIDHLPHKMVIDENYDLARSLVPNEFPPVIARLVSEDGPLLVLPPAGDEVYQRVIEHFKRRGARIEREEEVKEAELRGSSLILLGEKNLWAERLYGRINRKGGFELTVRENPWDRRKVAGIIWGLSKEEVDASFSKIFHYGKFSSVSFEQGTNVLRRLEESDRGIIRELVKEPVAIDLSTLKTLPAIIEKVADRKIIYVGETHDRFSHHLVQLEVIKAFQAKGKKVAIGMEMFQRPFQGVLDDYLRGKIGEKEFLKKSEYFKRWQFDYTLYRPILQFARSEKIPVIALNTPQEIVEKVARGGLDSLSEEEKKWVPTQMDFSDRAYRERLEKIFREHPPLPVKNFDFFYQAQILWDETMAESIDSFLKDYPGYQMVVLAGGGHLNFGSGIPKRSARRNGHDYAIILNDAEIEKDVAHYVLFPGTVPLEGSPKLMVSLSEGKGQVTVQGFPPGSVSEKAGIQKGDIILSLDGIPVNTVEDARLELLFKKKGDPVKVKILRKIAGEGDREMDFEVTPE